MKWFLLALSTMTACPGQLAQQATEPPIDFTACPKQRQGQTREGESVIVCEEIFESAPYVKLPPDSDSNIYGALQLDITAKPGSSGQTTYGIENPTFIDRNHRGYTLVDSLGQPLNELSELMTQNFLPSNRVHYLVYKATGKVDETQKTIAVETLQPVVMIEGRAIDSRFLGAWEGTLSLRIEPDPATGNQRWSSDENETAKIRVEFDQLTEHQPLSVITDPAKPLLDGQRYKAVGKIKNDTKCITLSDGNQAKALTSYGDQNPLPPTVKVEDYTLKMWRFPMMHTALSKDYHVVADYPEGLYPAAIAMATDHNFHTEDYISPSTQLDELVLHIHANPIDQLLIKLKPVRKDTDKGGDGC